MRKAAARSTRLSHSAALIFALSAMVPLSSIPERLQHVASNDHLHHLGRPLGDAEAALLAPEFLDRQIGGERDAAMDLHAAVGDTKRHLVGVGFRDIGLDAIV